MTLLALIAAPQPGARVMGLAKAIQLSVAPVFLLTAIAGVLGVISNRLGQIVTHLRAVFHQQHAVA